MYTGLIGIKQQSSSSALLEGLAIFRKLLDALMKLVEGHLVLQQCPSEFSLIVNE
jgi:hypothetical protein